MTFFSWDSTLVLLKTHYKMSILTNPEGVAKTNFSSSLRGKLGYLLAKSSLKPLKQKLDYAEYGGAPLLGIGGVSIISHGRSSALAIKNALHAAEKNVKEGLVKRLNQAMSFHNLESRSVHVQN